MSLEPELCLNPRTEDLFDSIDAEFFTGDTFLEEKAMLRAEWYIGRWQRWILQQRLANLTDADEE